MAEYVVAYWVDYVCAGGKSGGGYIYGHWGRGKVKRMAVCGPGMKGRRFTVVVVVGDRHCTKG